MSRQKCCLLACLTLGCFAVSPAVGDDESEIYAQYIGRSPIGVRRSLALPVDDVLSELSRRLGYSFIFDSRITKGKKVAPLNGLAPAEVALEQSLRGADLSLHKINETTFAIKAAPRIQLAALDAPASVAPAILIDAIVVTATALSKLASPESRHLFLIDDEALAFVVAVNPAEAIYELPQAFASITPSNTALYGATAGLSFADLRGLGPERTLVLVNGRRLALTPGGNGNLAGVDLNAIAEPFLERIEILSAPGGATLGTEAVAGSINFVTKKNISGLEAGAHYGLSQRGDAKEISLYLLGGGSLADGAVSVTGGINATSQAGLIGADREVTSTTWGFDRNGDFLPGYGGSTITPRGSVIGAILDTGEFSGFPSHQFRYSLTGDGGVAPFRGSLDQLHNAAAEQNFIIPVDRLLAYFSVDAEQESNLSFFAEGYFGLTRSKYQLSPLPGVFRGADPLLGDTVAVPVDHPTVPAELFQLYADEFGSAAENIVLERRYPELGPREQTVERSHADMTAGARIEPNDRLTAEFSYRFGRTGVRNTQFNRLDRSNFDVALDTSLCAATPGCVPINPFLIGGITEGAGDFLRAPPLHRRIFLEEHELSARVSVDVDGPFPETAYATGGLDLRRTRFGDGSVNPNFGDVGGAFLSNDLKGALSVIEGFAALNAPLLRSSVVGDLDLSIAGRVTGSSQYGPAHNIEAAADWSPTEGLRFFGKAHAGRRPPNIIEMFNVDEAVHATFFDPCGESLTSMSETVAENCFGDGALSVSDGFKQTAPLAKVSFVGNPDLEPERIWSGAYGVAIAPTSMFRGIDGDMRISATWLSHKIENIVGAIEAPLAACYSSPGFSSPACGVNPHTGLPLINRDPTSEQIVAIEWLMMNGAAYKWKGLDFQFDYVIEPAGFGPIDRLWVSGLHTLALRVESTVLGNLTAQRLDGQAADPRNRSRASIGGEAGPIALNLYFQRRGRVATLPGAPFPETKIPAVSTIDLTTRLKIGDKAVATFAVENLTDRDAPLAAFAGGAGGNTFPEHYDLIGRRFSIGLKVAM